MALYRKKPAFREANQWTGPGLLVPGVEREYMGFYRYYVTTTHGQRAYLEPGDYAVKEPDGNGYYPVKQTIFEAEHELVQPPEAK